MTITKQDGAWKRNIRKNKKKKKDPLATVKIPRTVVRRKWSKKQQKKAFSVMEISKLMSSPLLLSEQQVAKYYGTSIETFKKFIMEKDLVKVVTITFKKIETVNFVGFDDIITS